MAEGEQEQKVSKGALAVQSGRDTVIQTGVTPSEMRAILEALAPVYAAAAKEVAEARCADLEERLVAKFAERDKANPEAFKDPDFQYLIRHAQQAYARSGDEVTRDTLVDLIAKRSKEEQRSRLSLTLNEAVERSAVLTRNEFAELSLCYLLRYTKTNVATMAQLGNHFRSHVLPLLPDISREEASYRYLEAQSCATIVLTELSAMALLRHSYASLFSRGFDAGQMIPGLTPERSEYVHKSRLTSTCANDSTKRQLTATDKGTFETAAKEAGLTVDETASVWGFFESTVRNDDDLRAFFAGEFPEVERLIDLWDNTALKHLSLTTVGTAIGYANLVRVTGFDADLSIWIK